MAEWQVLLFVAYTERGDRIGIISARKATKMSKTPTSSKMLRPMSIEEPTRLPARILTRSR
jgi:hypothetical protein